MVSKKIKAGAKMVAPTPSMMKTPFSVGIMSFFTLHLLDVIYFLLEK